MAEDVGLKIVLAVDSTGVEAAMTKVAAVTKKVTESAAPIAPAFEKAKAAIVGLAPEVNKVGSSISNLQKSVSSFGGGVKSGNAAEKAADKIKAAKEALDKYVEGLEDVVGAQLKGAQAAQQELVNLQTLYNATQNANIPLADRKRLVDELQSQFPATFANISDEIILAGGAEAAYRKLSTVIIAAARARAAQDSLVDIQKQLLVLEQQSIDKLTQQTKLAKAIPDVTTFLTAGTA